MSKFEGDNKSTFLVLSKSINFWVGAWSSSSAFLNVKEILIE